MKSPTQATDPTSVIGRTPTMRSDDGFTLIELLIVIVILGVLATVVVFAVGGISDRGTASATSADEKTIVHAEEAHMAINGTYASESELVSAGFLRQASTIHDVDVPADRSSYSIGVAGSFVPAVTTTTAAPGGGDGGDTGTTTIAPGGGDGGGGDSTTTTTTIPTVPTSYYGFSAQSTGTGSKTLVIIGRNAQGSTQVLFDQLTATPLPDTQVIWLDQGDVNDTGDVDSVIDAGPNYIVAAANISIARVGGGSTFVGVYLDERTDMDWPDDFWWTHQQGNPSNAQLAQHLG